MNDISVWIDLLGNVGFPIAIAVYLLLRLEKKICLLANTIEELKKVIQNNKN